MRRQLGFLADDLDIPQIAVAVGASDDNLSSSSSESSAVPSPPPDSPRLPPSPSATDNHASLSPITPILRLPRDSLGYPTHSDNSSLPPPPSPTLSPHSGSVRWANSTLLRANNPEGRDGPGSSSSYLASPPHGHRRKGSVGTVSSVGSGSTTEQDADDNSSFRLSPLRSGHSDVTSTLPSPTHTHVDTASDAGSRPSSVTSFLKRTIHRVRQPSPSPSDTGSDTTHNDGQKGDNSDAKRKGAELARPAMLDLKQEADLDVHPFIFKPLQLASLVDPKSLEVLERMGGVDALLRGLGTHPTHGLSTKSGSPQVHLSSPHPILQSVAVSHPTDKDPPKPDIMVTPPAGEPQGLRSTVSLGGDVPAGFQFSEEVYRTSIVDRQRIFGQNVLPQRPTKTLLQLMWLALKDKVLALLSISAVVSLALGLFQDFGTPRPDGDRPVDSSWVDGVTFLAAVLIVVSVGTLNGWQKEKQFEILNEEREEHSVKVVRDGGAQLIHVHGVLVGDIVLLEPGEVIPCDGVFISGHNVLCDESSVTGESDMIKKLPYQDCIALRNKRLTEFEPEPESPILGDGESTTGSGTPRKYPTRLDLLGHTDCFVVSGSKIVEGVGSYLVISVGQKSFNGRIMMALRHDPENTPLQLKLNDLAEVIAKARSIAGGLLFVALHAFNSVLC